MTMPMTMATMAMAMATTTTAAMDTTTTAMGMMTTMTFATTNYTNTISNVTWATWVSQTKHTTNKRVPFFSKKEDPPTSSKSDTPKAPSVTVEHFTHKEHKLSAPHQARPSIQPDPLNSALLALRNA